MTDLRVAAVQFGSGLDPAENRDRIAKLLVDLNAGEGPPDLVVLPEAAARDFGTPGSPVAPVAEPLDGPFVAFLSEQARRFRQVVVAGMFQIGDDADHPFNTLVVVGPSGLQASYRKIHLYDSFGYRESDVLAGGPVEPVVTDVGGVNWGLMTCYDLRFPELARGLVDRGAEGLLVPSAWVAGPRKVVHWQTLLRARAIENVVYAVAAAQPGPRYTGHSTIIDPRGDVLAEAGDEPDVHVVATVVPDVVDSARSENPSLLNRRF